MCALGMLVSHRMRARRPGGKVKAGRLESYMKDYAEKSSQANMLLAVVFL